MKSTLTLLAILASAPCASTAQPTPRPICLTPTQAKGLNDSLAVLPQVRAAALAWHYAADNFERAAVEAVRADSLHQAALADYKVGFARQGRLLTSTQAERDTYKTRAHRKGWWNAVLAAALVAVGYLAITH